MDSETRRALIELLSSGNPREVAGAAFALFDFASDDPEVMPALIAADDNSNGPNLMLAMKDIRSNTMGLTQYKLLKRIAAIRKAE